MTKLVPHDPVQRATHFGILNGLKSKKGSTPYANAFFKSLYGKTKPTKRDLIGLFGDTHTIPSLTSMLNTFLKSNGTSSNFLPVDFKFKAFPSLKARSDVREANHYLLVSERDCHVEDKASIKTENVALQAQKELLALSSESLGDWLNLYEGRIDDFTLVGLLKLWYLTNDGCQYEFQYNMSHLNARDLMHYLCCL